RWLPMPRPDRPRHRQTQPAGHRQSRPPGNHSGRPRPGHAVPGAFRAARQSACFHRRQAGYRWLRSWGFRGCRRTRAGWQCVVVEWMSRRSIAPAECFLGRVPGGVPAFLRTMADGDTRLLGAVADAGTGFLGAVADLLGDTLGGMTHVAGAVGDAMTYVLRILLDALVGTTWRRLHGHAKCREYGAGEQERTYLLAVHAGHLVSDRNSSIGAPGAGLQA